MADEYQATRAPYTHQEDVFIIDYICQNKIYDKVKGASIWGSLSMRMAIKGYNRSWHSLKERFKKHIIPNILDYNLPSGEVKKLLEPFGGQPLEKRPKKEKGPKGPRKEYSYREDEALIKWVLKTKGDVKGNAVWQALEAKKIIPGRSWESLRNRFLRTTSKNLRLLLDEKQCQRVLRRIHGDLDFVDYPIERERGKHGPIAAGRDSSPSGHSASSGSPERNVSRRSSVCSSVFLRSPSASPQRLDSVARARTSPRTPQSQDSRKGLQRNPAFESPKSARSESSQVVKTPPKKGKKKLFTMVSDLDAEIPIPCPSPERVERPLPGPSASPAISGSPTKVPLVVLERCDETMPECVMPSKRSPSERNVSKSTVFSVSTMMVEERECCCDELTDETDPWEVVPCGNDCRHLIVAETSSPRRRSGEGRRKSRGRSGESRRRSESPEKVLDYSSEGSSHCRMNATCPGSTEKHSPPRISSTLARRNERASTNCDGGRRLPAWLSNSGPNGEESALVKSEPPDEDPMCEINPERRVCEFWDDERYIIDPLYADFIDKPGPFIVKDGVEYSWGPLRFPIAHPHTLNPYESSLC